MLQRIVSRASSPPVCQATSLGRSPCRDGGHEGQVSGEQAGVHYYISSRSWMQNLFQTAPLASRPGRHGCVAANRQPKTGFSAGELIRAGSRDERLRFQVVRSKLRCCGVQHSKKTARRAAWRLCCLERAPADELMYISRIRETSLGGVIVRSRLGGQRDSETENVGQDFQYREKSGFAALPRPARLDVYLRCRGRRASRASSRHPSPIRHRPRRPVWPSSHSYSTRPRLDER